MENPGLFSLLLKFGCSCVMATILGGYLLYRVGTGKIPPFAASILDSGSREPV